MRVKVLYQELLPDEFIERVNACPIAYLPLGTLEWHSFHLPYGPDMMIPLEMFKHIAEKAGGVVLPPLFIGPDGAIEHDGKLYFGMDYASFEDGYPQHLAGSMHYVPEPFFIQLLEYIIKNLTRSGFAGLVAFGHGPSVDALMKNRERLENSFNIRIFGLADFCGGIPGDHAAFYETAMALALFPELVNMQQLPDEVIPVSVWGRDPRISNLKEEGERMIKLYEEQAVAKLIELNTELPKPNLKLEYHHVRKLIY
ncbi:MAG TPA: creatininase family protein [Clostridia bacterium]|nr:creatininase family protein [Clostridia bacterium]